MARVGSNNKTVQRISWNFGEIEGYQFAGTDKIRVQTFKEEGKDRYFPSLYYTLVKPLTNNGRPVGHDGKLLEPGSELCVHAVPMISNFEEGKCTQDKTKYKWSYVPDLTKIHNFLGTPPTNLKLWIANQPDGMDVKYWYGIKANPFLFTTWSQGLTTLPFLDSSGTTDYNFYNRDDGYDFSVNTFRVNGDPIRNKSFHINQKDSSWYRHGCSVDIEYEFLNVKFTRTFIVYYDIEHKFYAFPMLARNKDITDPVELKSGSVNMKYVKTKKITWPSPIDGSKIGKDVDNVTKETKQRPDWYFSHNGKNAVCLPLIQDAAWSDGITSKRLFNNGKIKELKEAYPMLVEIELKLTITGEALESFDFDIVVVRSINPNETGRSIVSAQYAVKDFPDQGVKADDLIILEYEMYMNSMFIDTVEQWPFYSYVYNGMSGSVGYYSYGFNNYWFDNYPALIPPDPPDIIDLDGTVYPDPNDPIKTIYYTITGSFATKLYYHAGKSLRRPNLITLAKVKNLDSDKKLFSWVAHYSSHQVSKCRTHAMRTPEVIASVGEFYYGQHQYYLIDETKHIDWIDTDIKFEDWFVSVPSGNDYFPQHKFCDFIYSANIQSIELSTLSFLLLATVKSSGNYFDFNTHKKSAGNHESISGALQVFTAFGKEESRKYEGFVGLKDQIEKFYDNKFDITKYNKFDLRATIDGKSGSVNSESFSKSYVSNDVITGTSSTMEYNINSPRMGYLNENYLNVLYYYSTIDSDGYRLADNNHCITYNRSMNQNITINFGGSSKTELNVYNCAVLLKNLYFTIEKDDNGDETGVFSNEMKCDYEEDHLSYLLENYYDKNKDLVWAPKVFNFFDQSNFVIRPGLVHSRFYVSIDKDHVGAAVVNEDVLLGKPEYTGYPFGKIHFSKIYTNTLSMMNNVQNQIRTHPNGSFAVFSSNILAPTAKHSISINGTYERDFGYCSYGTLSSTANSGTIEYKQIVIDKIKIVYNYINKDKVLEVYKKDTTHIKMMNLAFNKTLTEEDYKFALARESASIGFNTDNLLGYSGGLKITKSWNSPQLENKDIFVFDQVYQDKHSGFDISKVIAPSLVDESSYPVTMKRFFDENGLVGSSSTFFSSTTHSLLMKYNIQFYISTPRMESIFYFNCPYIKRDENEYMITKKIA